MKHDEKQSETLEVRLGYAAKREFMEACRARGLTASEVVRDFVGRYPVQPRRTLRDHIPDKLTEFPMSIAASTLLAATLGASALLPGQVATADRDDPAATFAELDRDGDGHFVMTDLYRIAGLTPEGGLGEGLRADAMESIRDALDEFGPDFQETFLEPSYVERILTDAEESARESVDETFVEIDFDGDGAVSRDEFMAYHHGRRISAD